MQQGLHFALEFALDWAGEFGKAIADTGNAHRLNFLVPRVMIIGRQRIDFLEKGLRGELLPSYW
jgi:hypothetical protein